MLEEEDRGNICALRLVALHAATQAEAKVQQEKMARRDRLGGSSSLFLRATTTRAAEDASDGVEDGRPAHRSPFQLLA